ncbi:predicted protein [Naegleria gruberi]|uniref:Predicted protein n=1 Tax=Naegleria gruberi TaxID=5762 RepID=D2VXL2_NAEGR|nr:uncharacterized protein NAEGRDRAFT_81615 [Naegleria gruberi]EFC38461.1 predicted protein [Naegleria gruberi]|eukprot:XP_002671205.1 predicted protein [Naegleria gruberi strain NEG-M]
MIKQTSFYACGKGFFQDCLPTCCSSNTTKLPTSATSGISELTKIKLFDHLFHGDEELIKIEIKGLNMIMLTKSGSVYFTNSMIRYPSQFTLPNNNDENHARIFIDCSLATSHALFLTREGHVYSWNLKKKTLDDWSGIKKVEHSFDCRILRVLAFDNGQSYFIGLNMKVYMSEGGGLPKIIDIRKIQLCEEKAFVFGCDKEEQYFKKLDRVRVTNYHEVDQSDENIFLVGEVYTYRYEMGSFVCFNVSNGEKIVDMSCSNNHMIIATNQNRLLAMGHNISGQLGAKHFNTMFYNDNCEMILPFEREEDDKIILATDDNMTLVAHTRLVKKQYMNYPSLFKNIESLTVGNFIPLIELISKDCSNLIKNDNFQSSLNVEEKQLFIKLLEFFSFTLFDFNSIEDESFTDLLHVDFKKDIKSTITTLFLLNDISDIGSRIKETLFLIFVEQISLENVLDSLEQISKYLSMKVLTNSKTSVLMVAVKACFTFMKKNYQSVSGLYKNNPHFQKIDTKVQQCKNSSLLEISITWIDPYECNTPSAEVINNLYNKGELSFIVDHLGERIVKVHKSIISSSPVLGTLTDDVFGNSDSDTYNIFDFVRNSQDSEEEMVLKSNAIEFILQACYMNMKSIDNSDFRQLIHVFLIAHQFQIEHILKYSVHKLLDQMSVDNFENLLYIASMAEQEEWSTDFLDRLTVEYLRNVEPLQVSFQADTEFKKKLLEYSKSFSKTASLSVALPKPTLDKFHFSRQVFFTACNLQSF